MEGRHQYQLGPKDRGAVGNVKLRNDDIRRSGRLPWDRIPMKRCFNTELGERVGPWLREVARRPPRPEGVMRRDLRNLEPAFRPALYRTRQSGLRIQKERNLRRGRRLFSDTPIHS